MPPGAWLDTNPYRSERLAELPTRPARVPAIALGVILVAVIAGLGCAASPATGPGAPVNDLLATTAFHFPGSPPDNERGLAIRATPLYRELDRLDREGGPSSATRRIVEIRSEPAHLETWSQWLRDRYMYGSKPEALYGLFYFDALIALHDADRTDLLDPTSNDTMVIMVFVSSELLAQENVARCGEQPAGTNYRLYWRTGRNRGAYARRVWDKMSAKRQSFALRFARARVESGEGRSPSPAACASGIRAMQAAADAGLCHRVPASEYAARGDYVGGSAAEWELCDSGRFATFVDDDIWAERRAEVRARYWDRLFTD